MLNFTKSQKKIARKVIETGLQREYVMGIEKIDKIIDHWKSAQTDNRETYQKMYKALMAHDKQIARRYNRITGSKYSVVIVSQLINEIITEKDLQEFNEEVKQRLLQLREIYE